MRGGTSDERPATDGTKAVGEAGRKLTRPGCRRARRIWSTASGSSGPSRASGSCGRRPTGCALDGVESTPRRWSRPGGANFPAYWPKGNDFYPSLTGVEPGEVALIKLGGPAGMKSQDGRDGALLRRRVLHADDAARATCSPAGSRSRRTTRRRDSRPDAGADARAGSARRDRPDDGRPRQGEQVLGADTGEPRAQPRRSRRRGARRWCCVDRKRQWSRAANVRHSVAIRSTLHMLRPAEGDAPPA